MPELAEAYLDVLRDTLTRRIVRGELYVPARPPSGVRKIAHSVLQMGLSRAGLVMARPVVDFDPATDWKWPKYGETMVSVERLDNLRACIRTICDEGIPGDLVETGVWRGGASIFMRGALLAYGGAGRNVWLADSFEGLPSPDLENFPVDDGSDFSGHSELAVSVEEVRANFEKYGLLDDSVRFLQGWFKDTLGSAPIEQISLLRLDGDLYESTIQALDALYRRVVPGGFCVVDDYNSVHGCHAAVDEFRASADITGEMKYIDKFAVYWRV